MSRFSVVVTLVLLVHQKAKIIHPFSDEASKHTSASSKSKQSGYRVLALDAVRHVESFRLSQLKKRRSPMSKSRRISKPGIGRLIAVPRCPYRVRAVA